MSDLHNTCKKSRFTKIKGTQLGSHCSDTCLSLFQCCFVMVFRWNCPSLRPRYAWLWGKKDDRSRSILNKLECNFSNFHRKKKEPAFKAPAREKGESSPPSDFKNRRVTVWLKKQGFANHLSHKISILTIFYWQSQIYTCIVGLLLDSAWMQLIKFSTNNFVTYMESTENMKGARLGGRDSPPFLAPHRVLLYSAAA